MILPHRKRHIRPVRVVGDTAYVPLTCGYEAVVDAADAKLVEGLNWSVSSSTAPSKYATTTLIVEGKRRPFGMHRFLMGSDSPMIDHKDGDGLNNRRSNLRHCAGASQNAANKKVPANSTTGFKGVRAPRCGKWAAAIEFGGIYYHLGTFDTAETAALAYDEAAVELFGPFARTNFSQAPKDSAKPKRVKA